MKKYSASLSKMFVFFVLLSCANPAKTDKIIGESVTGNKEKPLSFQKIAPLTANALGARKNIHEKGWLFIPSSKESIESVVESGRMSSKVAKSLLFVKWKKRASDYPGSLKATMEKIETLGEKTRSSGTALSADIYRFSLQLTAEEWKLARKMGNTAGERFINGYLFLDDKVEEDTEQVLNAYSDLNERRSGVTKSLNELFFDTSSKNGKKLTSAWKGSYAKTTKAFLDEYEESGSRDNTLTALWDIFQGYTFALKELVVPAAQTTASVGETIVLGGVFVPVSHVLTVSGQTVVTTGMVLYYSTKVGYRVISPSLEAGLFSTMGIASASSTVPTLVTGGGISAFNQVTTVIGSRAGEGAAKGGAVVGETTALATGVVYDFTVDSAKSSIYPLKSGLILGYTALTALPVHLVTAVPDGTIFLTYDGPRVVIAVVRGNYAGFEDLPTGTIVDLEEAKKSGKVEILTRDPAIIKKVLDAEISEKEKEHSKTNEGKN
ncbi:hypothetical protein EHS11_03585 [Leptospira ilyithenensis]|uniref:Lipoprotein n=2 Tax=Leptospira ilyithenensis TaxID=2484901 RepID=A0A4R9LTM2_9LEPT|nr:hypothetical protein EHS11_03585 [Leptospira ilyithenensis]